MLALLFGLVGFAWHTLWIVAILVLALGLGYVVANARQNRRDVVDHRWRELRSTRRVIDPLLCVNPTRKPAEVP